MKFLLFIFLLALSLPGFAQEDDEATLQKLEQDRRKQVEMALKLNEARQRTGKISLGVPDEIRKLGHDTIDAAALMDERVVKQLQLLINESNLRNSNPELIRGMILGKVKGSYAETFLLDNPGLLDCFVDIIRDQRAMSSLLGIFLRKDDLKLYGGIWFGFLVLGWLFKKIFFDLIKRKRTLFFMHLLVSLTVSFASGYTFYKIFESELSPALEIIQRHTGF